MWGAKDAESHAMKPNILSLVLFPLLTYFATLEVKGVVPTPDGCYPNFTTAEGCDALNVFSPVALQTQESGGVRFFQIALAASIPASVLEH